jgi:hypothetical protein
VPTFYMTLSHNDVSGVRIEPYSLIPIAARNFIPGFWDWPVSYITLSTGQLEHRIRLNDLGNTVDSRIYYVPERSEFRFCADAVYALGPGAVGDVLEIERLGPSSFRTQVHAPGTSGFLAAATFLVNPVSRGGSSKTWGFV